MVKKKIRPPAGIKPSKAGKPVKKGKAARTAKTGYVSTIGTTLHSLRPPRGAQRGFKRLGRGPGSGRGKTSGRGSKGQGSRPGPGIRPGFEGGQMPLIRRVPKRGFHNPFRLEYAPVNVSDLARVFSAGTKVTPELLRDRGLVRQKSVPVKVLGDGDLKIALTIAAHKFSGSARSKIEAAGGKIEELKW